MPELRYSASRGDFEVDDRWTAVDEYVASHLHHPKPHHKHVQAAADHNAASGLDNIAAPASMAKFMALQCKVLHAKHALEVGTLGGLTSIWLATVNPGLRVTTLEVDPATAAVAQANFERAGVADRVHCIVGPALESLPQLERDIAEGKKEKIDFAFIDADKLNNYTYLDWAIRLSRGPGSCIVIDNVVAKGALSSAAKAKTDSTARGGRQAVERTGLDSRVEATVLQIVSSKDYDGFLMAVVN